MGMKPLVSRAAEKVRVKLWQPLFKRVRHSYLLEIIRSRGMETAYLLAFLFFIAGSVNSILEGSRPEFSNLLIIPSPGVQGPLEAVIFFFVGLMGITGFYLLYLGGHRILRPRIVHFYLVGGVITILSALLIGLYMVSLKL